MSPLKSTEVFFIYSQQRRKSLFVFLCFFYVIPVLCYVVLQTWGFRIVSVPVEIAERTIPHYLKKNFADEVRGKKQSIVVSSSSYGLRFGSSFLVMPFHKKPKRGDVVLVATSSPRDGMTNTDIYRALWKKAQDLLSILSFNIIKPATTYNIMRVVATEYEKVFYSGMRVHGTDTSRVIVSDDEILPYVNTDNKLVVPPKHVFLSSDVPYGLDSRYRGSYPVSELLGQLSFFIGPVWGSLTLQ